MKRNSNDVMALTEATGTEGHNLAHVGLGSELRHTQIRGDIENGQASDGGGFHKRKLAHIYDAEVTTNSLR